MRLSKIARIALVVPVFLCSYAVIGAKMLPVHEAKAMMSFDVNVSSNSGISQFLHIDDSLTHEEIFTNCNGYTKSVQNMDASVNFESIGSPSRYAEGEVSFYCVLIAEDNPNPLDGPETIGIMYKSRASGKTNVSAMTATSSGTVKTADAQGSCSGYNGIYDDIKPANGGFLNGAVDREYMDFDVEGVTISIPIYEVNVSANSVITCDL
ncbi:hypothetical protein [Armatimonas sp.]|uniref:hypothetical protein n=1 Tax=Armatimonas sp. TaxID=1872638 RepID=UPI00375231AA